jgi:hypothetical protein
MLDGACHCGAITLELETTRDPSELPVRACGCDFCVKHRPRYTSDPAGHVTIRLGDESNVSRYRFGHRLADFLVCRTCGVFVAAYEPGGRAVINLEVLRRRGELTGTPTVFTAYNSEDPAARTARRAKNWMPATLA